MSRCEKKQYEHRQDFLLVDQSDRNEDVRGEIGTGRKIGRHGLAHTDEVLPPKGPRTKYRSRPRFGSPVLAHVRRGNIGRRKQWAMSANGYMTRLLLTRRLNRSRPLRRLQVENRCPQEHLKGEMGQKPDRTRVGQQDFGPNPNRIS